MEKLAETYTCAWCVNEQPEDNPYLAWDWRVCSECWNDMERENYEDYERRKKEREEDAANGTG